VTASTIIGRQLLLRRGTTQLSNYPYLAGVRFCAIRAGELVPARALLSRPPRRSGHPLCQSSCRADKIGNFGGADSKQWLGTDRHTRTG
jgi:hypothetical protein